MNLRIAIMASGHKELGQIHTSNFFVRGNGTQVKDLDLSGELSQQLQRLIRQGNFFKVVGVDMTISEYGGNPGGVSINGFLRYFAPTRGRCAAYRHAFKAMRTAMELQGINMRDNAQYDFRVMFDASGTGGTSLTNLATLTGSDPLALVESADPTGTRQGILDVYNKSVQPAQTSATFDAGFDTYNMSGNTGGVPIDFVLNDGVLWSGNEEYADVEWESIPFQLSYSPTDDDTAFTLEWRPDPALYLAVMTGLFQVNVEEVDFNGDADAYELSIAVHTSGWKSIMGDPDKKKRSSRGRRRKSKK